MEDKFCVYVHVFPNKKRYYGITGVKPEKRWAKGVGYKNNDYMSKAIKKYGWNNIEHRIVAHRLTKEQAFNLEIKLIKYFKTNNRQYGYNISSGGEYPLATEETRKKISKNHADFKGKNSPNSKKVLCIETGIIYESIREAERLTGVNHSNISAVCLAKNNTAGGYHWKHI